MLNTKKTLIIITAVAILAISSLGAMQTSVYCTANSLIDDNTQSIYYGGELRISFLNHVKPFVAVGASAGVLKDRQTDTGNNTNNRYYTRPNTNSYLNTVKAGVELRMNTAGNYSCGVAVYGLFYDRIVNTRNQETGKKVSEHFLKGGIGAELSAIYNFRVAENRIVSSTTSSCAFRISGGYTFDNTLDIEVSCGVIFRFNSNEA